MEGQGTDQPFHYVQYPVHMVSSAPCPQTGPYLSPSPMHMAQTSYLWPL
jgi:hypothetical protein